MMNFKNTIILILLITTFTSCQKSRKNNNNKVLNISVSDEISTLDPANAYNTISASIIYQTYEPLYQYHYLKRPYTVIPLLAESMPAVSNNGLRYTIKIKKNIKYHDDPAFNGKPRFVKAQDFISQIKRLAFIKLNSNGWFLFDGRIKGINKWRTEVGSDFQKFIDTPIEGISAPDDHTLVFDLVKQYPQMLYSLTMSFTAPMPIEAIIKYDNFLNNNVIGTGPFKLDKWTKLSGVKLIRNKEYRKILYPTQGDRIANSLKLLEDAGKEIPFLDEINFKIMKESQPRWLNFQSKKIDYLIIPKDNYNSAINDSGNIKEELYKKGIRLQVFPSLTYWWLSFNMNDPILGKNKNLRMAIAHAIDVDRYIDIFTNKNGQKANSIYAPGIPGYNPNSQRAYDYDLSKAKEYLKKAGYPDGKGLPKFTFDLRGVSTTDRQRADFFKNQLAKIGLNIIGTINTFPSFLKKAKDGKLQFWLDGWAMDYPDAENILQLLYSKNKAPGPNVTNFNNPEFDKLFKQLKLMPDGKEKHEIMKRMDAIVAEELPWVMLQYSRRNIVYHSYLKNYRFSDIIYNNMKYLKVVK